MKTNNTHSFKYIRRRKLVREAAESLDDKGIKGLLKENREMAKKLNDFFFCICFHCGTCGAHIHTRPTVLGRVPEELGQMEVRPS